MLSKTPTSQTSSPVDGPTVFAALRDALAGLYPTEQDARVVVDDAELFAIRIYVVGENYTMAKVDQYRQYIQEVIRVIVRILLPMVRLNCRGSLTQSMITINWFMRGGTKPIANMGA